MTVTENQTRTAHFHYKKQKIGKILATGQSGGEEEL